MLAWSPDSASIVMQPFPTTDPKSTGGERTAPIDLSIIDLDGHVERTLPTPPVCRRSSSLAPIVVIGPQTLSWSPDGRWIAVHVSTGVSVDLWMVAADGSGSRRVASPGAGGITRFAWRPSGAVVTVATSCDGLAECGIWDIDVDDGRRHPSTARCRCGSPTRTSRPWRGRRRPIAWR